MIASGRPVSEVSQALGIRENIIYRWKSKQRLAGQEGTKGKKEIDGPATEDLHLDPWQGVDQLREKLRQTEMERDIWTSRRCQHRVLKKP